MRMLCRGVVGSVDISLHVSSALVKGFFLLCIFYFFIADSLSISSTGSSPNIIIGSNLLAKHPSAFWSVWAPAPAIHPSIPWGRTAKRDLKSPLRMQNSLEFCHATAYPLGIAKHPVRTTECSAACREKIRVSQRLNNSPIFYNLKFLSDYCPKYVQVPQSSIIT